MTQKEMRNNAIVGAFNKIAEATEGLNTEEIDKYFKMRYEQQKRIGKLSWDMPRDEFYKKGDEIKLDVRRKYGFENNKKIMGEIKRD